METYFKILVATDYSAAAMNAERYALQFAKSTNSTIRMLHVYERPFVSPFVEMNYTEKFIEIEKRELKKLENHRDKLFSSLQINPNELNCECIVTEGITGKQILKEADQSEADFIIIGTHGTSGLRENLFGTNTWKVIKKAGIPVLAIPQETSFTGIKNMVYATEYRGGEIPVIQFLAHLAKQYDSELTILHILNRDISKEMEKKMSEKFLNEIKNETDHEKITIKIIKQDHLVESLNNYSIHNKVDWLIMSPEKQFLFEKIFNAESRIIKKMAIHTHVPLFTVPDFYNPVFAHFWDMIEVNSYMSEEF